MTSLKHSLWVLWIPCCLFFVGDRVGSALADHRISPTDWLQISIATFFLLGWLVLKPTLSVRCEASQN